MSEKSFVTMVTRICRICGNEYSTNELALDQKLRPIFERNTCMGWGECDKHKAALDSGMVALVEIDEAKSIVQEGKDHGLVKPGNEHRTGRVFLVKREYLPKLFTVEISLAQRVLMVDRGAVEKMFPPDVMKTIPDEQPRSTRGTPAPGSNSIN